MKALPEPGSLTRTPPPLGSARITTPPFLKGGLGTELGRAHHGLYDSIGLRRIAPEDTSMSYLVAQPTTHQLWRAQSLALSLNLLETFEDRALSGL